MERHQESMFLIKEQFSESIACISLLKKIERSLLVNTVLSTCLFLALNGCSSTTLTSGVSLSKIGQTASSQMEPNVTILQDNVLKLKKSQAFMDGFNNSINNNFSTDFLNNMSTIQKELAPYGKCLESLKSAYSALGDLAGYDSAGSFNSATDSLTTDTQSLAKTLNFTIPKNDLSVIKPVGDFILGSIQAWEVKDASKNIEALLNIIINILDNNGRKQQFIGMQTQVANQILQASSILIKTPGVINYQPEVDDLLSSTTFRSSPGINAIVSSSPKIKKGLDNVNDQTINASDIQKNLEASYDTNLKALKELRNLHDSLQNDAPLNLEKINDIVNNLQINAALLKSLKG